MEYCIQRTVGLITDTLSQLWEGNDLPTFKRDGSPYMFDDQKTAERVLWRLQAKYPTSIDTPRIPAIPITYELVSIDKSGCHHCGSSDCHYCDRPDQHLACFV